MARPIRNTPILYGKDAEEFIRRANTPLPLEERMRRRKKMEEGAARFRELCNLKPIENTTNKESLHK